MNNSRLMRGAALAAMSCLLVASCSDEGENKDAKKTPTDAQSGAATASSEKQPSAAPAPSVEELRGHLPEDVASLPWAEVQNIEISQPAAGGGAETVELDVTLRLKEDLCEPAETPDQLNLLRQNINPLLNKALTPESHYLLQAGADPAEISDEDRRVQALPPALEERAEALKRLAEPQAFKVVARAGETLVVHGSASRKPAQGESAPGEWSVVVAESDPLAAWKKATPQSALPEGSAVLSAAWLAARTQEIETAMGALEKELTPYIAGREEAARARLLESRAAQEARNAESEKRAEEVRRERARFLQAGAAGKTYEGEWALDEQGGKLALTIVTSEAGDRSAMLTANLTDPDLPQASVELKGRCLLLPEEGEDYRFQIAIVDGLYDPDAATARIYDASDGVLLLNLGEDGTLEGVLTCKSWGDAEKDQVVRVVLKPSAKSGRKSR